MSLLKKIRESTPKFSGSSESSQSPAGETGGGDGPARPREICRACGPTLGRNFWLDAYDTWHCAGCDPPAVPGQIRGEMFVEPDGTGRPAPDPWGSLPGLTVLAVFWPDGTVSHNPRASTKDRRQIEALEHTAWFRNEESQKPRRRKSCWCSGVKSTSESC